VKPILLAALLLASCSKGGPPDVRISDAWARETISGQTSTAAYMILKNEGAGDDRLVSVSAQPPAMAMLHSSESSDAVARMRPLDSGVAVPAGATIELKPGGTHVMVTGLRAPLNVGDTLKLTMHFEKSGEQPVNVRVTPAFGLGPRR
jgi:copper(I)-binding protein